MRLVTENKTKEDQTAMLAAGDTAVLDYCDAPDEAAKNPDAKTHFLEFAKGDAAAFEFMWGFWCFFHCYDDLVDRDKPVPAEVGVQALANFLFMISFNSFYQTHKDQLFPFLLQVCNRWLSGDEWERSDDVEQQKVSHVVRCGDLEMYFHIAFLTGGWEHMRAMKFARGYDINASLKVESGASA